jgi:6,7-dimethyl-8-ribityllumazine synthase
MGSKSSSRFRSEARDGIFPKISDLRVAGSLLPNDPFRTMSLDAPSNLRIDGSHFTVGVVATRYNTELVEALLKQVVDRLIDAGVHSTAIQLERVPGSNELPFAAQLLAEEYELDVIIALGVLIRGDTIHYQLIAESATQGLQSVALSTRTPVINGVVVAETLEQAEARCRGEINRGAEFAHAALEMAALKRRITS